eukprot:1373020-Amorphochlora_amoeboformis.AAC.1
MSRSECVVVGLACGKLMSRSECGVVGLACGKLMSRSECVIVDGRYRVSYNKGKKAKWAAPESLRPYPRSRQSGQSRQSRKSPQQSHDPYESKNPDLNPLDEVNKRFETAQHTCECFSCYQNVRMMDLTPTATKGTNHIQPHKDGAQACVNTYKPHECMHTDTLDTQQTVHD